MRKKLLKIVLHITGVTVFIFATAYALLAAYGYQIDLLHQNFVKTSIIDLSNEIKNIQVYFDDTQIAKKIPYQIKNVKPGEHELKITKEGYKTWQKIVNVSEDVVTKIEDILLIPQDLEIFKQNYQIDLEYNDYILNKNYLVLISRDKNEIYLNKILDKNISLIETLSIDLENTEISFIDYHRLLLDYGDNLEIIDLRTSASTKIIIPDEFSSFKIAYTPYLRGYYLNEGNLYSVEIDEEGIFQEIKRYELEEQKSFEELNIISSYDNILFLCDDYLYIAENNYLTLIDKNIAWVPSISSDGVSIVYLNDKNEIYTYDIYESEKQLIARFIDKIHLVKWHNESKHIYLIKNSNLLICDLEFSNCNKLLEIPDLENLNITDQSQIIFLNKDNLLLYDLNKIL